MLQGTGSRRLQGVQAEEAGIYNLQEDLGTVQSL